MDNQLAVTPKAYFRALNVLFLGLVGGQVVFALVSFAFKLTQPQKEMLNSDVADILIWVAPAIALAGVMFSQVLFRSKLKLLRDKSNLAEKLQGYQSEMIIQFAIMEGPSFFALILFYLTGNYIFLGTTIFIILLFLINRPSKSSIVQQLQLHDDERMLLDDPDAVLFKRDISNTN